MRDRDVEDRNLLLARASKNGDAAALNQLLVQNERAIYSIAKKHVGSGIPFDDLLQIGREGYWQGIQDFEEWRGANVNTMAMYGVRRKIHEEIMYWKRKKRFVRTISYEYARVSEEDGRRKDDRDIDDHPLFRTLNPEQMLLARDEIRRTREKIQKRLKDQERFVLRRHFGFDDREGPLPFVQIAELMGCNRSYPGSICLTALKKIRMSAEQMRALVGLQLTIYAFEGCFEP